MSGNEKIGYIIAVIFFILFAYSLYLKNYYYAVGWILLSLAAIVKSYTPKETGLEEIFDILTVALPIIALALFLYAIIYL